MHIFVMSTTTMQSSEVLMSTIHLIFNQLFDVKNDSYETTFGIVYSLSERHIETQIQ